MIRWRNDLLNGRWRVTQGDDDYWRVHDTTTGQDLTRLYLTSRDARRGAEEEYYLAAGILVRGSTLDNFTNSARRENW